VRWIDTAVCLVAAGDTRVSARPVLAAGEDALALCAAAAAAWASGLAPELIAAGLEHFDSLPHP
jgi:UDP-N-acetylmuramoylalanine-D-glutamate ligase